MQKTSKVRVAIRDRLLRRFSTAALGLLLLCQGVSAQAPASVPPQQSTTPVPLLVNGEHTLKGGETHSYRVSVSAGQFLHVIIEQKDIDVLVSVFGPDGKQLSETDSPNDRWGSEAVLLIAESSGEYRIDVRSSNSRAATGGYAVRVVALRDATALDRDHAAAGRAFDEARKLRAQPGTAAQRAAIEKYESAIALFKTVGDAYRLALSLVRAGAGYMQLSEFRRALPYFDETIRLSQELRDIRLEAGAETFLGGIHDVLGDVDKAVRHHTRALQLSRQSGARLTEANALNNLGKIYGDSFDWQKALEYYRYALSIYEEINSQRAAAITLNNIGIAYQHSGEADKALEYLQQSLPLLRAANDKNAESYTLSNIGNAHHRMGQYDKALEFFAQARALQQQTGNRAQEAETLDLTGLVYSAQGQPEKALDYHQRALEVQRATGNLRREALALASLGNVYNLLQQPDKALSHLAEASSRFRAIGDLNGLAVTLERTARAHRIAGEITKSRTSIEEALRLIETVRARSVSQQLRASYLASRDQAYEFYIDLLMQQHAEDPLKGHDAEALRAVERGRARSLMEMLAEASVNIRQGIDANLLERERTLAQLLNAKAQRQIQLLAQKGSTQEIDILKREISGLEDNYQEVQAAIRRTSPAYAALTQPQPLGLKEIQQQLDGDSILLEYSLGDERSYLWAVTPNSLKSFELPKREQIQESARHIYNLLTARSQSIPRETIAAKKQRISEADAQLSLIRELSRMVLPAQLELGSKRLVVVADGALQYVPFGAFSLSRGVESSANVYRPLIADHEVVTLPSASALAVHRNNLANRKLAANAVAVIADPVFSTADERLTSNSLDSSRTAPRDAESDNTRIIEHIADDSTGKLSIRRLRFTREEAEQILAVAPRATNLKAMDFKATRAMAISGDLSRYRYVHFATHGYIDSERSDLSAIVLSLVDQQGNAQDGFLRAHEVYNLNLPAELVVLSACQTGLGKEIKGEGLVGLTQAFMYAGARRVVVSLWSVNDKATAELMRRFYRGMLKQGRTPAAALRQAQFEMSQDAKWQSPYYWAPFVLQGEWR